MIEWFISNQAEGLTEISPGQRPGLIILPKVGIIEKQYISVTILVSV